MNDRGPPLPKLQRGPPQLSLSYSGVDTSPFDLENDDDDDDTTATKSFGSASVLLLPVSGQCTNSGRPRAEYLQYLASLGKPSVCSGIAPTTARFTHAD